MDSCSEILSFGEGAFSKIKGDYIVGAGQAEFFYGLRESCCQNGLGMLPVVSKRCKSHSTVRIYLHKSVPTSREEDGDDCTETAKSAKPNKRKVSNMERRCLVFGDGTELYKCIKDMTAKNTQRGRGVRAPEMLCSRIRSVSCEMPAGDSLKRTSSEASLTDAQPNKKKRTAFADEGDHRPFNPYVVDSLLMSKCEAHSRDLTSTDPYIIYDICKEILSVGSLYGSSGTSVKGSDEFRELLESEVMRKVLFFFASLKSREPSAMEDYAEHESRIDELINSKKSTGIWKCRKRLKCVPCTSTTARKLEAEMMRTGMVGSASKIDRWLRSAGSEDCACMAVDPCYTEEVMCTIHYAIKCQNSGEALRCRAMRISDFLVMVHPQGQLYFMVSEKAQAQFKAFCTCRAFTIADFRSSLQGKITRVPQIVSDYIRGSDEELYYAMQTLLCRVSTRKKKDTRGMCMIGHEKMSHAYRILHRIIFSLYPDEGMLESSLLATWGLSDHQYTFSNATPTKGKRLKGLVSMPEFESSKTRRCGRQVTRPYLLRAVKSFIQMHATHYIDGMCVSRMSRFFQSCKKAGEDHPEVCEWFNSPSSNNHSCTKISMGPNMSHLAFYEFCADESYPREVREDLFLSMYTAGNVTLPPRLPGINKIAGRKLGDASHAKAATREKRWSYSSSIHTVAIERGDRESRPIREGCEDVAENPERLAPFVNLVRALEFGILLDIPPNLGDARNPDQAHFRYASSGLLLGPPSVSCELLAEKDYLFPDFWTGREGDNGNFMCGDFLVLYEPESRFPEDMGSLRCLIFTKELDLTGVQLSVGEKAK